MKSVLLLMAALALGGCATPYGTPSLAGGYNEYPVNKQLMKVNFFGNGYISSAKVQTYTLYRCAELARDAKKPHFVIYDSLGAAARDRAAEQPRVGALGGKPLGFAFLRMLDEPRDGSMATQEVLARLGPEVRNTKKAEIRQ
jgi:hypothetical protein